MYNMQKHMDQNAIHIFSFGLDRNSFLNIRLRRY